MGRQLAAGQLDTVGQPARLSGRHPPPLTGEGDVLDAIAPVGVEAGQLQRRWRETRRRRELRKGHDRLGSIRCVDTVRAVGIFRIEADHVARMQQRSETLVEFDQPGQRGPAIRVGASHVPLHAEMPEHGRGAAERECVNTAGGVCSGGPDVCPHHLRRNQHRRAALDGLAFERIVAVAGPDTLGAAQDLVVDSAATARTRLELDVGVPTPQFVEQGVQRNRLLVRARGTGCSRTLHVVAVHVPLHVADVVIGEECVELAEHVGERLGARKVEHQLVAPEHRFVSLGGERPVRMRAVQLAVGVDHLRLDPDPELQTQAGDVLDQRRQPVGVRIGRHHPIAQARGVVAS